MEVIDRSTDDAIQRLVAAGLIAKADRAVRPLDIGQDSGAVATLSAEEEARLRACRSQAGRKLKMVRLLLGADLAEEAGSALKEPALQVAKRRGDPRATPRACVSR